MKREIDWRNLIGRVCIGVFIVIFVEKFMQIDVPWWMWCGFGVGMGWL